MDRLAQLLECCRGFSSTLDLERSLSLALGAAERLVGSERSSIWSYDEERRELRFMVMRGEGEAIEQDFRDVRMGLGEGIVGWVAQHAKPIVIPDAHADSRWSAKVEDKSGFVTRSILSVPLEAHGRLIGVLQLLNKTGGQGFGDDDLFLLESLSSQIAIAMENATLYERVRNYNEQLRQKVEELETEIAERRRAERERREVEEQLRQAQKIESIGQLAGGIAHDFNNLLTPIKGYAQLALMRQENRELVSNALRQIDEAGERAQGLTRQILAFSRRQPLEVRALSLTRVVREFQKMLRRLIRADVEIEIHLDDHVGSVRADASQIEQILLNLAVNARDAMPDGGTLGIETADVDLDEAFAETRPGARPGPYAMLAVSDTGCGMDARTISRMFEPFFTTKQRGQGTGLGLATVYGIVKQHEGYVYADSAPGKGTTFRIYLPRVDERPEEPGVTVAATPGVRGDETILLVEDDSMVRRMAAAVLREHGYQVLAAPGAEAAIECSRGHDGPIDLLITDVIMPGAGGRDLAQKLRTKRSGLRVLLVSGYVEKAAASIAETECEMPLLRKPFSVQDLLTAVRDLLGRP